jgi:UDP-glucose 4-epimerase
MLADRKILVTGGAGFFGGLLKRRLLADGVSCISVDLVADEDRHPNLISVEGDIRDRDLMQRLFAEHAFATVYHCAAVLAHAVKDKSFLWTSNVDGTRVVAELAERHGADSLVFISSNCLWAHNLGRPVREDDPPAPIEIYGQSKWEAEKVLAEHPGLRSVIIRCPTIIEEGRLGLLAILFEFIDEGRRVWVVGGGDNVYQFIYAPDLAAACMAAAGSENVRGVFNIGSDNVKSFREVYQYVIDNAGTRARVASLPRRLTLAGMQLAHALGLSPLGPYQYRMIAEDFVFDTAKIKDQLGWRPTLSNEEMLWRAYRYYHANRAAIEQRKGVSAHREAAKMGVIRLLKWVS